MNNRGLMVGRLAIGIFSFFVLTILFMTFDPVIEDSLHGELSTRLEGGDAPLQAMNRYLVSWQSWVAIFILAIFIYMVLAGVSDPAVRRY